MFRTVSTRLAAAVPVPAAAHTSVTKGATQGVFAGVNTVFVRSVLGQMKGSEIPLRDSVDVLPGCGIDCAAEVAAATEKSKKSALIAAEAAAANGSKKVTVFVKQQTKYANLNKILEGAAREVCESKGVAVDFIGSAALMNNLIMFPENIGVVLAADTPAAENAELAFGGVAGPLTRSFVQ